MFLSKEFSVEAFDCSLVKSCMVSEAPGDMSFVSSNFQMNMKPFMKFNYSVGLYVDEHINDECLFAIGDDN
jgi:hypothetical protein